MSRMNAIAAITSIIASAIVGWLVGWLVGASSTPVVATLIPLVFGLTAILWQQYQQQKERIEAAAAALAEGATDGAVRVLRGGHVTTDRAAVNALVLALAIIAFAISAYLGTERGVETRVPHAPTLSELLGVYALAPSPREAATLERLRLDLSRVLVAPADVRSIFASTVVPILRDTAYGVRGSRREIRPDVLAEISRTLTVPGNGATAKARGPASVKPDSAQ
ncbi:MAG: hypothetical protein ACJ796_14235 [Gemmatimonadaceae bacterium]